uniref:tRNA (34-2'-O)-methyltransferase regulator WDR6 n=1 Tax=Serinus canaria TaxID=9135 RepID=A0A8C9MSL9_SERCA
MHVASHRLDKHWEQKKNRHKDCPRQDYPYSPTANWPLLHYRIFGLLEAARKLVLVAESFHHQRCVLKVEAFLHTWSWAWGEMSVLPVLPALEAPLITVVAHSCGVNSLHIRKTPEGRYLVASGSDDGSIHVCLLEVALGRGEATAGTCLQVLERVSRPCAHAAHVTGIRVLRPDLLLSASVDQRLTLWNRCPGELVPLSTTFFHVPDLAELDCWEAVEAGGELRYYCVLCGQGLEMLCGTFSSKPPPQEAPQ